MKEQPRIFSDLRSVVFCDRNRQQPYLSESELSPGLTQALRCPGALSEIRQYEQALISQEKDRCKHVSTFKYELKKGILG